MTPEEIGAAIRIAVSDANACGEIAAPVPRSVTLSRPSDPAVGNWATPVALHLGARTGAEPRALAEALGRRLVRARQIDAVHVAGPGFLNITVSATAHADVVKAIVNAPEPFCPPESVRALTSVVDAAMDTARWAAVAESAGTDAARFEAARTTGSSGPARTSGAGGDDSYAKLRRRTSDNPVFSVQFAHARAVRVGRAAAIAGVRRADGFDPAALHCEAELIGMLGEFRSTVRAAADDGAPRRVVRYLETLAETLHARHGAGRVVPRGDREVDDAHRARLWLNDAVRRVLAAGLTLLGVSAPDRI